jgi:hypothetical protein
MTGSSITIQSNNAEVPCSGRDIKPMCSIDKSMLKHGAKDRPAGSSVTKTPHND